MTVAGPELAPIRERKMFFGEAFIRRLIERRAGDLYPREIDPIMERLLQTAKHEPSTLRVELTDVHNTLLEIVKNKMFDGHRQFSQVLMCGSVRGLSKRGSREVTSWKNLHVYLGEDGKRLSSIDWTLNYRQTFPEAQPSLRDSRHAKTVRIEYWEDGSPAQAFFIDDADPFSSEKAAVAFSIRFWPNMRQSSA